MNPSSFCFSPLPIADYQITSLGGCEVSGIMSLPADQSLAVWNLMWLSLPTVDSLPVHGSTPQWFKHYSPTAGAARAITADAIADEALFRKLRMHPTRFLTFFERENHSIYDCYAALGGERWVRTVMTRAHEAALRMAHMPTSTPLSGLDNVLALFHASAH